MSRLTQDTAIIINLYVYVAVTLYRRFFQIFPLLLYNKERSPLTPTMPKHLRFGLFRVRSPLLTKSLLFSFPAGNEMFQFPAFAPTFGG